MTIDNLRIERVENSESVNFDSATQRFAYLNQELSEMIEDGKFSKKQYNRFIKITEQYENCSY